MRNSPIVAIFSSALRPGKNQSAFALTVRQAIAGAITTVVDLGSFQCAIWLGISMYLSAAISMVLAFVVNFSITRWYVFGEIAKQKQPLWRQLGMYAIVAAVGIGIIQLSLWLLTDMMKALSPILAKTCAIPIVFMWTLFANKRLVFYAR